MIVIGLVGIQSSMQLLMCKCTHVDCLHNADMIHISLNLANVLLKSTGIDARGFTYKVVVESCEPGSPFLPVMACPPWLGFVRVASDRLTQHDYLYCQGQPATTTPRKPDTPRATT